MTKRSCKTCGLNESAPFKAIGADDLCIGCRPELTDSELIEDGICPECKVGELEDMRQGSCYCSTTSHPPCSHCTRLHVCCDSCDFEITESY